MAPRLMRCPQVLKRYYGAQDPHFITCSCYHRLPILGTARCRDGFLKILEEARRRNSCIKIESRANHSWGLRSFVNLTFSQTKCCGNPPLTPLPLPPASIFPALTKYQYYSPH